MIARFLLCLLIITSSSATLSAQKDPEKKKRGTVTVYYPNSKQVWYTGQNKNSQKEGTWTYYAPDGKITRTDNYKADLLHGERKVYLSDILIVHENYFQGKPHGGQQYYSVRNIKRYTYYFTHGSIDSVHHWNYSAQWMYTTEIYTNNKVSAIFKYSPHGLLTESEYYENGLKTGVWKKWIDTIPVEIVTYKNNLKNGYSRSISYDGNEKKIVESYYTNDTLDGLMRVYLAGRPLLEYSFRKGLEHGLCKQYYKSGSLYSETTYFNGSPIGKSLTYDNSGHIIYCGYWKGEVSTNGRGLPDSLFYFNSQGKCTREDIYSYSADLSQQIHRFTQWSDNGQLLASGQYVNGEGTGIWIKNYNSLTPYFIIQYNNNKIHGKCEFWYENGKKAVEFVAENGDVFTAPFVWTSDGTRLTPDQPEYINILYDEKYRTNAHFLIFDNVYETPMEETLRKTPMTFIEPDLYQEIPTPSIPQDPLGGEFYLDYHTNDCFPGGDTAIASFIRQHTLYPAADVALGNEGKMCIYFRIDQRGQVCRLVVYRDYPNESVALASEASRLIQSIPWQPPIRDGKPVSVYLTVCINFELPK